MKIEYLILIDNIILTVYYTSKKYFQYEIILDDGPIYQPDEIYFTAERALKSGRQSLEQLKNYLL